MSLGNLLLLMKQINAEDESKMKEALSPEKRKDGRYVTSEGALRGTDGRIFRETQVKRLARWLSSTPPLINLFFNWLFIKRLGMKLDYFTQEENKNPDKLYKQGFKHEISSREHNFTIHNLGHATQLIQTEGMNILTDPVFGDLAPLIYPSTTKPFSRDLSANDLPAIDVILISHNHRDHVDVDSLKQLIKKAKDEGKPLPRLLVPLGDEKFFRDLGFTDVKQFEWHEQITLYSPSNQAISFCATPADHRSGRKGHDHHKSLVTGWTISPKNRDEIVYFAGDTARLSNARMDSLALDIYHQVQHKTGLADNKLPRIINMEPGGPNYTRRDMEATHQSAVDSIVSAFRLAVSLEKVETAHKGAEKSHTANQWLDATSTVFMHHNKFELGPDRFNENVFIYSRLLSYLKMSDKDFQQHKQKQAQKSTSWSLFERRKDFITQGVEELKALAAEIWPAEDPEVQKQYLIEFIEARTHFPLINEKLSADDVFQFEMGETSSIIPDTFIEDGKRRKGEKLDEPEEGTDIGGPPV